MGSWTAGAERRRIPRRGEEQHPDDHEQDEHEGQSEAPVAQAAHERARAHVGTPTTASALRFGRLRGAHVCGKLTANAAWRQRRTSDNRLLIVGALAYSNGRTAHSGAPSSVAARSAFARLASGPLTIWTNATWFP